MESSNNLGRHEPEANLVRALELDVLSGQHKVWGARREAGGDGGGLLWALVSVRHAQEIK